MVRRSAPHAPIDAPARAGSLDDRDVVGRYERALRQPSAPRRYVVWRLVHEQDAFGKPREAWRLVEVDRVTFGRLVRSTPEERQRLGVRL